MPYLMGLFDEICFEQLIFKSPRHDMCRVLKQSVYDYHGFSKILGVSLNKQNFRTYVFFCLNATLFFAMCLLQTVLYQTHLKLQSSNLLLKLVELHTISLLGSFTHHSTGGSSKHTSSSLFSTSKIEMAHLSVCLYLNEIILS